MNIETLIAFAAARTSGNTSAELCLSDARALLEKRDIISARRRAIDSLKHSRGILHADYVLATAEAYEVYNSDCGTTLGETLGGVPYAVAVEVACDWNHEGAPNLFRIRPVSTEGAAPFTCGAN